jgi:hypothetical protein
MILRKNADKILRNLALYFYHTICPPTRHERLWGNEGIEPLILNLDNMWRYLVNLTPQPLLPRRRRFRCLLNRTLAGSRV